MKIGPTILSIAMVVSLALEARGALAAPPTTSACTRNAERAQLLRRQGKLAAACKALATCAADACPAVVRDDCRTWMADLQALQPTIAFSVRTHDGADVITARVSVDGKPLLDRIDGLARAIDPGPHDIEVEAPDHPPVHLPIVVHEGEKGRLVTITLPAPAGESGASPAVTQGPASPQGPEAPRGARPITPWIWVTGAVAVAGVGGFTYFGLTALSDHAAMRDGCATTHSCTDADVASNKAHFWIADISLLVGIASAGLSAYLIYDHTRSRRAPAVDVSTRFGGPYVNVTTTF